MQRASSTPFHSLIYPEDTFPGLAYGFFGKSLWEVWDTPPPLPPILATPVPQDHMVRQFDLAAGHYHTVFLNQRHTARAVLLREGTDLPSEPADGVVTACPGVFLGLYTADCVPVLFYDAQKKIIGAAHAGWRGALAGVLENTVQIMNDLGSCKAQRIALLGPAIHKDVYEVDHLFYQDFLEKDAANSTFFRPGIGGGQPRFFFDLLGYVRQRLEPLVKTCYSSDISTGHGDFFSRRERLKSQDQDLGRNFSFIGMGHP